MAHAAEPGRGSAQGAVRGRLRDRARPSRRSSRRTSRAGRAATCCACAWRSTPGRHDLGRRSATRCRAAPPSSAAAWAAIRRSRRRARSAPAAAWPAFEERSFEAFRSYYEYLPQGKHVVEYTRAPEQRRATSRCRRAGSRRCMRRRCSARCRMRVDRGGAVTRLSRSKGRVAPSPAAGMAGWLLARGRNRRARSRPSQLRRRQGRAPPFRHHPARPPRRADPDAAGRQGGAPPRLGAAVRDVAGAADGDRPERGPALLGARRRRLGRRGAQRLGQPDRHAERAAPRP